MIQRANSRYSHLETICRQAEEHFSSLVENMKNVAMLKVDLGELQDILECLPLATDEYDLTVARINNAQRYLESSEHGAAKYEIRQLIRSLRSPFSSAGNSNVLVAQIDDDVDEPSQPALPAA